MKSMSQDLSGAGWPEVYERPPDCCGSRTILKYLSPAVYPRVPEPAMELPLPPQDRNNGPRGRGAKSEQPYLS